MSGQLGSTKPIESLIAVSEQPEFRLEKRLGRVALITIGIGAIIGSGIYVLSGIAASGERYQAPDVYHLTILDLLARYFTGDTSLVHSSPPAGPAVTISLVILGAICLVIGFCYAELATLMPVAGSVYTYSYAALGEFAAWMAGWVLTLEYGLANVDLADGFSNALRSRLADFHILIPLRWSLPAWSLGRWTGSYFNAPAFLIIMLITLVLSLGIRAFSRANMFMVVLKSAGILLFVAVGSALVHPGNWHPFAPAGMKGILAGGMILFYAYVGFDCVSVAAEEARQPERDIPIGILGSIVISGIFYIAAAAIIVGIVPYTAFRDSNDSMNSNAVISVLQHSGKAGIGTAFAVVFSGMIVGLASVLFVCQYSQTRIWYAMSRDGFLPNLFSLLHPKTRIPHWCTWIGGVGLALCAGLIDPGESVDATSLGVLVTFALIAICVLYLRRSQPERKRPFKVPYMPWLAWIALIATLMMMASIPLATWFRFLFWLLIGVAIYAVYGRHHSRRSRQVHSAN